MDREEAANKQNERTTTSQEKEAQAGRKYSPETLAKVDRFCEILQKMDREAEQQRDAANKQQATRPGNYSASF